MLINEISSASTDRLIAWLDEHRAMERERSYPKGRRWDRQRIAAVQAELERRGRVAAVARDIEAVATRDERTRAFDVWKVFLNPDLFRTVVDALSSPFTTTHVTKVVGLEARGFPLAAGVALALDAGFVPVRKAGTFLPGPTFTRTSTPDYQKREIQLSLQGDALRRNDRVVIVDDWAETGAHLLAATALVRETGAELSGVAVMIDQLADEVRAQLPAFHALTRYLPS